MLLARGRAYVTSRHESTAVLRRLAPLPPYSPRSLDRSCRVVPGPASMRITDVEPIVLRLAEVDTTRADGTQDAFLVRIHTDEGIVGIGEADTSPYLARTIVEMPSSHSIARGLKEVLVGEDPLQIDRLWQLMFHASDHYGRAGAALHTISAIDIALWDIAGKAAGRPVCDVLGGRRIAEVPVYASEVMPESVDEVRGIAERAVGAGYSALKLGWGPLGRDPEHDVALVGAARDTLGAGAHVDARRRPGLQRQVRAPAPAACRGARPVLVRGGARARRPRRVPAALGRDHRADRRRRGRCDAAPVPRPRGAGPRRCAAAGPRALRGLHGRPPDRAARAQLGRADRPALLLDGHPGRGVAPFRRHPRPADVVGVLRRRLDARERDPAASLSCSRTDASPFRPVPASGSRSTTS